MTIPIISHIYPTRSDPSIGIFIQKEARLINTFANLEVHIPSVLATPFNKQFYRSFQPVHEPFPILRFKYLSIPKRKFQSTTQKYLSEGLIRSLRNSDAKLVHLHWLYPGGLTAPELKKEGYSVILTIHGGDWYSNLYNNKLNSTLQECLFACDHIISVGQQLKDDILSVYPGLSKIISHIPHAIDTEKFFVVNHTQRIQEQLGWNPLKNNLLCVANLYKVKGVDILVEAFAHLKNKNDIHLHIVAPRRDKKISNQIVRLIQKHKLANKITFYGSMSEEELIPFYQAADLFISPSLHEGFGLAVAESAACGTPVLATKSGGPSEIITAEIGQLIEPGDAHHLSNSISEMLSSIKEYDTKLMHESIKSRFGREQKIYSLKNIYNFYLSE